MNFKWLVPLCFAASTAFAGIDVVFVVDESGSMGDDQADVKANANTIFAGLPAGSSAGVVGYGNRNIVPRLVQPLTSDSTTFANGVGLLGTSGSREPAYQAVYQTALDILPQGQLGYTGDPVCIINITDERLDQGGNTQAEALTAMQNQPSIYFGIVPQGTPTTQATVLAAGTGGAVFDLIAFRNDPVPVLNAVIAACVEAAIPVVADAKPTSCPNPFKVGQKGVMPWALLGSDEFDVSYIDETSLVLNGACPALRTALEDVATPYDGERSDPPLEGECTTDAADGFIDLTVKFDSECAGGTTEATERGVELWEVCGEYDKGDGPVEFCADDIIRVMP